MFSVSLNSMVQDEDGNETELINTLIDQKTVNSEEWLDFKFYYQRNPEKVKRAIIARGRAKSPDIIFL